MSISLISNREKSISNPSLRESLITTLFISPSTLIKFIVSSQLDPFPLRERFFTFRLIKDKQPVRPLLSIGRS